MNISREILERLARFDTPTICNVIELFDVRPRNQGYMDDRVRCQFPHLPPMVGFAATAAFRSDAPPAKGDAYGSLQQQLEQFAALPGPAVVVFQDLDDPPAAAVFGDVMCSTYQAYGSAGLVTNGTGGTICSHGYCHILHLGLPVRVGRLMVNQGDLLHGDANGVTNIPLEIVAEVADLAADLVAAEEPILSYVKSQQPKTVAQYDLLRKEFQATVAKLTARVSRKK
jgi:regulator of RNase E activity RraA